MKIYGYPGDRVDFVSKSGGAGAMVFGDPRQLSEVSLFPGKSKHEKVDIYLGKTRLSGLDPETLRSAAGDAVEVEWDGALQSVTFR